MAECEPGTYGTHDEDGDGLVCEVCHRDCATCTDGEHEHCITCAQHLLMSPTTGCVTDCPVGYVE